ncbi:MAG TPA: hypothetical protein VNA25_29630 [Phycisphaerae bacterium]|nr:hypothetical protein [Phycisphaerae bacterium]
MMAINDEQQLGKRREVSIPDISDLANDAIESRYGIGAVAGATITAVEKGDGVVHKTVLTCTALPITITDEAAAGQFGGSKVYDFPAGLIMTLGAVIDGSVTAVAPIIATWDGDVALGTAAPTDHATGLVVADTGRYLQSTATTQAVAFVGNVDAISIATGLTETAARCTDGTATALDLFLNLLIDDNAAHVGAMSATFTGTITIAWINLGDK